MHQRITVNIDDVSSALGTRFTISTVIRTGGQAIVYDAIRHQTLSGEQRTDRIAIKVYFDPDQDERVLREIAALEGFRHPSLANLVEHGVLNVGGRNLRFIAWEFVEGEALDERLRRGPIPAKSVVCILRDVSRAIEHIWAKRIVHRDVNPKNIMLRRGEQDAVLIDLGVARHLDRTTLTAAGLTWGTLGYLSPEQARGEPLTCKSDVFSLGLTAQELLLGQHPTGGDQRYIPTGLRKTGAIVATAPAPLAVLIDSMLSPRAAFRPTPSRIGEECADLVRQL